MGLVMNLVPPDAPTAWELLVEETCEKLADGPLPVDHERVRDICAEYWKRQESKA